MAQLLKLRLIEGNDDTVELAITRNGAAVPLADADIELLLKTTEYQTDDDAVLLSRDGGEITVTDADAGLAEATLDGSLITADLTWWRCDVIDAGARHTALYGDLEVTNV
ncbi:hypothetical protein Aph01nite_43760 [Acrocarpospora phusangensis]|uniref:Uncharacterized protein n=1 Tax=Acrocarpospora phusangensis TaxID=1070424 RepID=A0A919QC20_9ACTN|nr:hypothetical protein [Acrocarpospora phusangensis]GIH26066.1 hypothetical protein Aph01nite_43760 [Acrocarpospora phusangensis]